MGRATARSFGFFVARLTTLTFEVVARILFAERGWLPATLEAAEETWCLEGRSGSNSDPDSDSGSGSESVKSIIIGCDPDPDPDPEKHSKRNRD